MAKNIKKLFALILAISMVMSLSVNAFSTTRVVKTSDAGTATLDKTAEWSDEKFVADVTLSVGGDSEVIGSDIVYIVGSYATDNDGNPNPEGDILISSLMDTITEMVNVGTVVNFGIVPFSSDNEIAMELTPISEENLAEMPALITEALGTCEAVYDGVNMENALIKAAEMLADSDLADYPERQHLVMISSGQTYFFNTGKDNESLATVPVNYTGVDRLFFWNKAWQRARTNQTNTYPIPKGIVEAYEADDEGYDTLWDFYWSYIDQWVNDDIDAGDKVVYEATTVESGDFLTWFNSGELVSGYSQTGYGKAIPADAVTEEQLANAVTLTAGANPLTDEAAAHAIGNERAMWEAYEFCEENIIDAGINFYPIYNELNANYTNGSTEWCNWTDQYIGHSFMNMLAGGEAVMYDKSGDKAFFDPIKNKIMKSVPAGSYVDDYMGYGDEDGEEHDYDFDFIDELDKITLKVGLTTYSTTKLDTPTEGFDSSYAFTAPEADEPTFWLDYVKGNGTSEEMFRWTYGEDAYDFAPVVLDYQVRLVKVPNDNLDELVYKTNKEAILKDPDGDDIEEFPIPELEIYSVTYEYVGDIQPENAPELPATDYYTEGATVTVADDPSAEGYVFSGWSETGTFEMPAEDVVITGSWDVASTPMVPKFAYEVRYFLEQLDGSYEEATDDFYRAFDELGATVSPAEKAYENYVLNTELSDSEGIVIAPSVVDGELNILRMNVYFDYEAEFNVTYQYVGNVQPENAPALPEGGSYKVGEIVTVADDVSAEGYVFSGWSETGTFEMPAEDVVITGSWDVASTPMAPKFAYEVRYFQEQRDGSYEEVTADFYRAFDELGATVSPAEKAYEHYVLNTELSDAQGTVIAPSVVDGELNILRMNVYFDLVRYTVTYIDRGEEVQFTEELISGDEIPGCEDPESYYDKYHKYSFQNWILVEGEEGEDSTIGTTDLVYESVYKRTNKPSPTPPSDSDDDPDVEILDDEVPLAEIPALFGDDHYAYIIGYTDGLVHPEANITRAEVATIFFRLLDEEIRNTLMTDVNDFPDVEKGQWYNHAVSTLSSMGIVLGRNDGNFYPNDFITRAEFAAIAARFDPSGNPEGVFFSDIAGHWAEREIIIAANNGWVEGYNGLFRPDDYITRAEAMTLVNRVLHRLPETEHDLLEYMVIWPDNMNVDAWYYLAVQEATNSHDYIRKTDPIYESWTEFIEPYDWSLLEY